MFKLFYLGLAFALGFTTYDVASVLEAWSIPRALVSKERFGVIPTEPTTKHDFGFRLTMARSQDGMYVLDGRMGDAPVEFVVDTGASFVVINHATADAAGVAQLFTEILAVEAATGAIEMRYGVIPVLRIGTIELRDVEALLSPVADGRNLLGMSFLGRLKKVEIANGAILLRG